MKVIDGRWQDQDGKPINDFNGSKFIEIREKVKAMYGEEITSTRINIISSILTLSEKEENSLVYLLNRDDVSFSKLAGF